MGNTKLKKRMNVWRYLALGYLLVLLLGSVLLVLPFSAREGQTSFVDALFTSVSAGCVTGLVPFETNVHWSEFGQAVILVLIQLGGLGFMTFVSVLLLMVKRGGLGQYERRAVLQSVGGGDLVGVKKLVRRILLGTLVFEAVGTGLLSIRFVPVFGTAKGIWYALFHAVSAFCNAGFDILGGTELAGMGSLSYFAADPLVSLTLIMLIFVGGLGFCVWGDVLDCRGNPKKFQFYTRVILIMHTAILLVGTLLFLGFEWGNAQYADMNFGERLLAALFNSATARTAGFWTTDPATLSDSGSLLMIMLMFIGGCSGSTAGGIKVGTFTVIIMGMWSAFRSNRDITIGKRRIGTRLFGQALAIFAAYLMLILISTMVICAIEPDVLTAGGVPLEGPDTFTRTLFEVVSALGTVGLSMGYTGTLTVWSKLILVMLMYLGRVGVLTLAFALGRKQDPAEVRRPVGDFFVG